MQAATNTPKNPDGLITRQFPVLKMSCASCAVSVESMMSSVNGVSQASVNFATATATVTYNPALTDPEELQKAVQSVGYDLFIESSDEAEEDLEALQQANYESWKKRTIGALVLSLPVVILGMFFMNLAGVNYWMWALSTPVVLWFGRSFFSNAWRLIRRGSVNMDTLVALSTGTAYLFSVFNTLYPAFWESRGLPAHVYFEAAAVVIAFILLGKLLEERAKGRTSSAIRKLMGLQPKTVLVENAQGQTEEIPVSDLQPGQVVVVRPGERIAVDGEVVSGSSYVDESSMTGEPVGVLKETGAKVLAGTINQKGSFRFRAERVGRETLLSQIIQTVKNAQGSRAPVQNLVDRIAAVFVPAVIGVALLAFLLWWVFGGANGFTQGMLAFVTVLVIACPCALGLATPTAIMVGVGKSAESGILIKDAENLEKLREVTVLVLDKTGTITEGHPRVTDQQWYTEDEEHKRALAALEKLSEHPLALAVVDAMPKDFIPEVSNFNSQTGLGAEGTVNGRRYLVGNSRLMEKNDVRIPPRTAELADQWESSAKTVIWYAADGELLAVLALADAIKPSSGEALNKLRNLGLRLIMITGDQTGTAQAVAEEVGIKEVYSGALPEDKLLLVKDLQAGGEVVAMAGDGINDSAALARADVSIAMGRGSDVAMDVAGATIVSSDLNRIPLAIALSKRTVRTIRQNLFWAFIYNVIGIPVAAGILYPFTGYMLSPMIAGAAMAMSSVSVVWNSLRLRSFNPKNQQP